MVVPLFRFLMTTPMSIYKQNTWNRLVALIVFMAVAASLSARSKSGLHQFRDDTRDFLTLGLGPNYMFGDMGGAEFEDMMVTEWDILYTRPSVQLAYEHDFNRWLGASLNVTYSLFGGNDEGSRNAKRKFEYYTNSVELSLRGIFYFYQGQWGRSKFDVYGFVGIGNNWYWANWYCEGPNGKHYKNRDAWNGGDTDTEIPGVSNEPNSSGYYTYQGSTFTIPFGIGVRLPITPYVNISADFGWRWAFGSDDSDFMDGMQTIWSDKNDTYAVLTFSANVNMEYFKGLFNFSEDCYAKYGRAQYRSFTRSR